jgi:hypothetical protein
MGPEAGHDAILPFFILPPPFASRHDTRGATAGLAAATAEISSSAMLPKVFVDMIEGVALSSRPL